jgi:nucleoside-diphosphate-sugar epimerase
VSSQSTDLLKQLERLQVVFYGFFFLLYHSWLISALRFFRNLALLRSAKRNAPGLKSVVVTGSINAVTTGAADALRSAGPISSETWLPISREEARKANHPFISYCSAKKEGELAIWDFIKTEKPCFTVTVFLPGLIFGPPLQPVKSVKNLNFSVGLIYNLFNGSNPTVPATMFPSSVDARDLADAHVKALTTPAAANRRLLINCQPMSFTMLAHALAKNPELAGRISADSGEDANVVFGQFEADADNAVIGLTFRTLDETMADTARKILELEKAEAAA